MAAALLVWIYITLLAGLIAWPVLRGLGRITSPAGGSTPTPDLAVVLVLGVAMVGVLAEALSLFMPIGLAANLILLAAGLVYAFFTRRDFSAWAVVFARRVRAVHPLLLVGISLAAVAAAGYGVITPQNFDTGFYHAQSIHWIETYPAVPGLGNLFGRLAFNSAWFLPSALFSFSFLGLGSLHLLNPWLCFVYGAYALGGLTDLLARRPAWSSLIRLGTLPPLAYFLVRDSASPGTDLPAAILIWLVLLLFLKVVEAGKGQDFGVDGAVIALLAAFAVTVKLAALPLLVLPLYLALAAAARGERRALWAAPAVIAALLLPWVARNAVLSGYLAYPVAALDVLRVDWKVPPPYALNEQRWITSWARIPGVENETVLAMPLGAWLPVWLGRLSRWFKLIFAAGGLSVVVYAALGLARPRQAATWLRDHPGELVAFAAAALGVLYWFWSAPDPRFGYGFIFFLALVLAAPTGAWVYRRAPRAWLVVALAATLTFQAGMALKAAGLRELPQALLLPAPYPAVTTAVVRPADFAVNYPGESQQCWYAPLPCAPFPSSEVVLRGATLREGFRNIKFNP